MLTRGTFKYVVPRLKCHHSPAAPSWWHVNLGTTYLNVPLATVHHLYNAQSYLFDRVWAADASGYMTERLRPATSRQTSAVVGMISCLLQLHRLMYWRG